MRKKLLSTLFATSLMMLGVQSAYASVKLTALSGCNWSHGTENPNALVDEQTDSKWGTWDGKNGNTVYIIMKSSDAIAPKSYELTTANDTNNNEGRSWSQWKIYGGNFTSDAEATLNAEGWMLIDSKKGQSLNKSQYAVNKMDISETIASGTYYSYFKIVVEAVEGGFASNYCQMDGFRFTNVKFAPQEVTFTCTAGKNFGNNEGIDKMFDLDCNTKYCGSVGSDCYALVTASEPVYVWGYDLTTANDNNNGRKVKQWSLYGTNDATVAKDPNAEGWVTLSNLGENSWIEGKNWYTQRFFCDKDKISKAYKYFKVVLDKGDGTTQLSEFRFCYDTHRAVAYNWVSGPSDAAKNAFDGKPNPKWEGNNGDFVGKSFTIETADGNSYAVKKYHFTTNDDGSWKDRAPKKWTIEGSDDNSNWTKIADVDDKYAIHNANYTTYEFTPSNTTDAFRYLKLTINSMKGDGHSQIGDFQVLAVSEVSDKDYYTGMVNNVKANEFERGSLSETDPWYVEYKALLVGLDDMLSTAISTGDYDNIIPTINRINALVPLMTQFKDGAQYVAFDGTACWGDGHYSQLLDGDAGSKEDPVNNKGTKWGGNFSGEEGDPEHVQYLIFRSKEALQPYFYKLVTGWDTEKNAGRNWDTWDIFGGNFNSITEATPDNAGWDTLDIRAGVSTKYLPVINCNPAMFDFSKGVDKPYIYYMVKVFKAQDGSQIQMNEMYLCTEEQFNEMRQPMLDEFANFDTTRPIEASQEDNLALFLTSYAKLQTTSDAIELTEAYNQCVALRAELEANMDWVELNTAATPIDGVYQLGTAANLVLFSKAVNGGKGNLNAVLTADIDLNDVAMDPIGTSENPYIGSFDGQGKAIKNYTYNHSDEDNAGLFGLTSGATIKKVLLSGANINGNANAAGLVGNAQNATTIENCAVVNSRIEGRDHVAAIAGNAKEETVIRNNYSDAEIVSRQYQAGGMVGTIFSATIEKNLFAGTVTCQNSGIACGLVSRIDGIADPAPVVRNNMVAASAITGGETHSIIKADWEDRPVTFADNYTLKSIVYTEGGKVVQKNLTNKDDLNGMQVTDKEATCKSFYETLGWDMENDWKFLAAGQFPVLAYMDANVPAPQEITVSKFGYATVVAENELDFTDSEAKAYIAQVKVAPDETLYVHLEPITIVPAGEPFVVKAAANTYNIPVAVEWGVAEGNDLNASKTDIVADGTQYVLANAANGVGFYKAEGNIPAGKGYIELDGIGPLVKALFFAEDGETAINNVNVNDNVNNGAIYNVAGQRISKLQKGINIVNGKKVLK